MSSQRGSHAARGSFARDVMKRLVIAVVFVAVVVVVVTLVARHFSSSSSPKANVGTVPTTASTLPSASVPTSVAPTTVPATTTSSTTSTTLARPDPSTVSLVVINGTTTSGAAGYFTTKLNNAGYHTGSPLDATATTVTSTLVIVSPTGTRAGGEAVAAALGLANSAVKVGAPASAPLPAGVLTGSDVVVLVGTDISGQTPSVPTTTAGGTGLSSTTTD
jgi:LytR cell envelope-related transcriptional attenuator